MLITPTETRAARDYLATFSKTARAKGEALFRGGAVLSFDAEDDLATGESCFDAIVRDGGSYGVALTCDEVGWIGTCDCSVEEDCKHCYAGMLAILEEGSAVEDGDPVAEEKAPAEGDDLPSLFAQRLGRKLKASEVKVAQKLERLFENSAEARMISAWQLHAALGIGSAGWSYEMHELWPEPPRSAWDAWLYIAHFLRGRGLAAPQFLLEATTDAEIEECVHDWERRQRIEQWQKRLDKMPAFSAGQEVVTHQLRAIFHPDGVRLEIRNAASGEFEPIKKTRYQQMVREHQVARLRLDPESRLVWQAFHRTSPKDNLLAYEHDPDSLNVFLRNPLIADRVVTEAGEPFRLVAELLHWDVAEPADADGDYTLKLVLPDGTAPPPARVIVDGDPALYVTGDAIYQAPPLGGMEFLSEITIPAPVVETARGVALLDHLRAPLPPALAKRTRDVSPRVIFRCQHNASVFGGAEDLLVTIRAEHEGAAPDQVFDRTGWQVSKVGDVNSKDILRIDHRPMQAVAGVVAELKLGWNFHTSSWLRRITRKFPDEFSQWLQNLPSGIEVELDPMLASLRDDPVAATMKLEVESSEVDWFDLRVALDVSDTTLTDAEIKALLDAHGGFVRLGAKGWRRLVFNLNEEDETQLAEIGLSPRDLSSAPQRLHALQLAGTGAARLLPDRDTQLITRRVEEIQARVAPAVPVAIRAEMRPYQIEGFHFLAYLSTNRFGGILADDMGLGKTLQALAWLAWLREQPDFDGRPSLVVCPKSVVDNWQGEADRFLPGLRVRPLARGQCDEKALAAGRAEADLVVVNYAQLRALEEPLSAVAWQAVILDEAQAIKNPQSQTARIAIGMKAAHRLALSGTPIENRLLDLWSIMAFAMPGILGPKTQFTKRYDQRSDPLARRRLAARVRPFVLRRTKNQVARDLPERTEEDRLCEMEGIQETLYQAELKRARQHLLKLKTSRDLDKARFHILSSLLRLRQICCHPALVSEKAANADSAKLSGLLEMLEPLLQEGHKVLVFSQFVEMLAIIQREIVAREWPHFLLTGQTENRGALVSDFQQSEGGAVFLISLRAGGFGLNLTAASYVVLFDPWWNPAVESQAIDRTHRIGQTSHVFAYRLLIKNSIEEKIRGLQKQKSAIAGDILGEESFARALTLDDFQFLLA